MIDLCVLLGHDNGVAYIVGVVVYLVQELFQQYFILVPLAYGIQRGLKAFKKGAKIIFSRRDKKLPVTPLPEDYL